MKLIENRDNNLQEDFPCNLLKQVQEQERGFNLLWGTSGEVCLRSPNEARDLTISKFDNLCKETAVQSNELASSLDVMKSAARKFIDFVNNGPSPYHVVNECRKVLSAAGFKELKEKEHWNIKPSDKEVCVCVCVCDMILHVEPL